MKETARCHKRHASWCERGSCNSPYSIVVVVVESELEDYGCVMVVSKSFLDSARRMVESWVFAKRGIVRLAAEGRLWRG